MSYKILSVLCQQGLEYSDYILCRGVNLYPTPEYDIKLHPMVRFQC